VVRSIVRAPAARASRIASSVSAAPTPWPRADSSTTTSSIQARSPVGMGNVTRVRMPMISPPARAASRLFPFQAATCRTASASSVGADLDS
jgi:hypothetical protein